MDHEQLDQADRFAEECRRLLASTGIEATLLGGDGAANLVFSSTHGEVYRFPRRSRDCDRIHELADRCRRAAELGLGAPGVMRVVPGGVGTAHLVLTHCPGSALNELLPRSGSNGIGNAVANSVLQVLERQREVTAAQWPFPARDWVAMWQGLPDLVGALKDSVASPVLDDWLDAARAAAVTAAGCPLGLVHGDLANVNALFSSDGRLTAVIDWDDAVIGDPAVDTAGMLHGLPSTIRDRLIADNPWVREDLSRVDRYAATWEPQHALWLLGQGLDPAGAARDSTAATTVIPGQPRIPPA